LASDDNKIANLSLYLSLYYVISIGLPKLHLRPSVGILEIPLIVRELLHVALTEFMQTNDNNKQLTI